MSKYAGFCNIPPASDLPIPRWVVLREENKVQFSSIIENRIQQKVPKGDFTSIVVGDNEKMTRGSQAKALFGALGEKKREKKFTQKIKNNLK
jgi:hypothetical protein